MLCVSLAIHGVFVVIQGDAAFWWNLKKSGEGDMLTRHAGCPVLVGTKWGMFYMYALGHGVIHPYT